MQTLTALWCDVFVGWESEYDVQHLRRVSVQVATEAAELAQVMRADAVSDGAVTTKSTETDVVTAADTACERLVRDRLAEVRPGEQVLGEEGGGDSSLEGLRWVVDPIDGTVNYLYGYPSYAVSVAAQIDGRSVAGAVAEPCTGRVWSAADGHGADLDGAPLRVTDSKRLDLSLIATGFGYSAQRRARQAAAVSTLLSEIRDIRRAGAASLDLCAVAAGWVDAYYEHGLKRWDWAAGALIAREAGARVRLPDPDPQAGTGDDLGSDAMVCAAPGIAEQLTAALRRCGAATI